MCLQVIRERKSHRMTVNHENEDKHVGEDEIGNNMIIRVSLYLVNTTIFLSLCVLQHYMFWPSVWAIIRCV